MKFLKYSYYILLLCSLAGCIGVDVVSPQEEGDLRIITSLETLKAGEMYQMEARYTNSEGMVEEKELSWSSSDADILSVTATGLTTAHEMGEATIYVSSEEMIDSVQVLVSEETVVTTGRAISFQGANGYSVSGSGMLEEMDGNIRLTLNTDFSSASGPGLYLYFSNSPNSVAIEIAALQSNTGMQTYTISDEAITLNTYDYVMVYCKPFSVLFGIGTLEE